MHRDVFRAGRLLLLAAILAASGRAQADPDGPRDVTEAKVWKVVSASLCGTSQKVKSNLRFNRPAQSAA